MSIEKFLEENIITALYEVNSGTVPVKSHLFGRNGIPRQYDGLIYITEGSCIYTVLGKNTFTANTGNILFLKKGDRYIMDITKPYGYICIDIDFKNRENAESGVIIKPDTTAIKQLFENALQSFSTSGKTSLHDVLSITYKICSKATASEDYQSAAARKFISDAVSFIDENLSNSSLTVSGVAAHCSVSVAYLRRIFNKKYGISPAEYITETRIEAAKRLISGTFSSLEDAALDSGFSSLSYFCRVFKRKTSMTPSEYRKLNSKKMTP